MNLKMLSNTELDSRVKSNFKAETNSLHETLMTLKEVEARKSYLELGFSSLYKYLTLEVGYEGGSAQRRIDAIRLMMDVPEVSEKIQSGEVSLSQVTLLQRACRQVQKTKNLKVSSEEKLELLEKIATKDSRDSQREISSFFDMPVIQNTLKMVQSDGSVRYEFTASAELNEKIELAQALLSNAIGDNDFVAFLSHIADKVIKQKTQIRNLKAASDEKSENTTATRNESQRQAGAFTQRTKKTILQSQNCCQYVDPVSKRQCKSNWFLNVDHKQSRWSGGGHSAGNGQILCHAHNQMKYRQEKFVKLSS